MARTTRRRPRPGVVRGLLLGLLGAGLVLGGVGYYYLFAPAVVVPPGQRFVTLKVPRGATYDQVLDSLRAKGCLRDEGRFVRVSRLLKYPDLVKYGYYRLNRGTGTLALVRQLRAGAQSTVDVVVRSERTVGGLARTLASQLEAPADSFATTLSNADFLASLKLPEGTPVTPETALALVLPNTYEVYWTTSTRRLVAKLHRAYLAYWTDARRAQAQALGLTPLQVSILASIVQEENLANPSEWPRIAGVYLNRLDRGMPLQADPTVKFAVGDFTLRRVLNKHLAVESPYNTYRHTGLPPGPINCPEPKALEAVLSAERHRYLYFVAAVGGGATHHFSETLSEHNRYADRYRQWLNQQGIR